MNALFIHIPKTAGTSIRQWYNTNINNDNNNPYNVRCYGHVTYRRAIEKSDINFDWSFCVVRNTYERLVSLYLYSWNKSKRRMEKAARRGEIDEKNTFVVKQAEHGIVTFLESFLIERRTELAGDLLISQIEYSKGVDYILRHESINDDFKKIQKKLNCYAPLIEKRNYMGTEIKKINYYTDEFFTLVEKYFKEEIDYFNFKRPANR